MRRVDLIVWFGIAAAVAAVLAGCAPPPGGSSDTGSATAPAPAAAAAGLEPEAIARAVDPIVRQALAEEGIPGAAFVFVERDRVVYAQGYGTADRERGQAVDAEATVWPMASVTKLVTAVAALQLVDDGRLALDEDINRYLRRIAVPGEADPPLTLAHLLSHTGGLDELPGRQFDPRQGPAPELAVFLADRLVRYREPGRRTAYSTYGVALAAVAIEDVSGLTYEEFVRQNILEPCGMTTSRFMRRLGDEDGVAKPYAVDDGEATPIAHEWYVTAPTSSLVASAVDMGSFARMHLADGRCGDRQVLSLPESRAMWTQQATIHPAVPGWGYGFQLDSVNGRLLAEHGGDIGGFSSLFVLIPEEDAGFFIVNHGEGNDLRFRVKDALLDALYPDPRRRAAPQPNPSDAERLREYAGRYRSSLACHTCGGADGEEFELAVGSDGTLELWGQRWVPLEGDLFVRDDGERLLGFSRDSAGRVDAVSGGSWRVADRVNRGAAGGQQAGQQWQAMPPVDDRVEAPLHPDRTRLIGFLAPRTSTGSARRRSSCRGWRRPPPTEGIRCTQRGWRSGSPAPGPRDPYSRWPTVAGGRRPAPGSSRRIGRRES